MGRKGAKRRHHFGPSWPEVKGFGAGPNKQIFYILAGGQNVKNSLCGHRGIACRFVRHSN